LSLPSQYGNLSKVYTIKEKSTDVMLGETPSSLNMYVLSYNADNTLRVASAALKQNLITYLSQYRMLTDSLKIKDAFIINVGVDFDIIVLPNYNNDEVLLKCIQYIQQYFKIDKWQINQPIILRDLYIGLDNIEGVQTVKNININNKTDITLGYSQYAYDISAATLNNIIYPSIDPMIFEVKYPNTDIKGRVVSL
jgi:phage-related baseplate assembly protein